MNAWHYFRCTFPYRLRYIGEVVAVNVHLRDQPLSYYAAAEQEYILQFCEPSLCVSRQISVTLAGKDLVNQEKVDIVSGKLPALSLDDDHKANTGNSIALGLLDKGQSV